MNFHNHRTAEPHKRSKEEGFNFLPNDQLGREGLEVSKTTTKRNSNNHPAIMIIKCEYCYTSFSELKSWEEHIETHTGYRPYICVACGMTFRKDIDLDKHTNYHVAVKKPVKEVYPCGVCGEAFQSDETIRKHILEHNDEWPIGCDLCSARFTQKVYLACHRNTFHSHNGNIACTICSEICGSKTRQVAHMKSKHNIIDRPHKCTKCDSKYTRNYDLQLHIRNIHCSIDFNSENDDSNLRKIFLKEEFDITDAELVLDNPIERGEITDIRIKEEVKENDELSDSFVQLSHTGDIKNELIETTGVSIKEEPKRFDYTCSTEKEAVLKPEVRIEIGDNKQNPDCKKEEINEQSDETTDFPITVKPIQHIRTGSTYKCSYCDKTFSRSSSVKEHEYSHTGENPYHCSDCDKRFRYASHYNTHLRFHANGVRKLYKCDICGRKLSSKTRIKEHMRLHSNERPYICEMCDGRFISANYLSYHQKSVHQTGSRATEYKCEYCNKTFSRCSSAREHQNIHTGDKPYLCNDCGKSFRYSTHFARHLRMHTNKEKRKSYECNICSKSISTKYDLIIHIRLHTNERPYACDLCDSREVSSRRLSDHKRMFHGANEGRVQKPFTHFCSICDKKYRSIVALNFHQRKHEENRNYSCSECGDKFRLLRHLQLHRNRIHLKSK